MTTTARYVRAETEEEEHVVYDDGPRTPALRPEPAVLERVIPIKLWRAHLACGLLEFGSAIAVPLYTIGVPGVACYQSVYTNAGVASVLPMGAVPVYTLVLMMFMSGFVEHLFCVILHDVYVRMASTTAWFRWISYAFVWPLMMMTVGYGSGIREGFILVMMAGLALVAVVTRVVTDMNRRRIVDPWIPRLTLFVGDLAVFWALLPVWGVYTRYVGTPPPEMSAIVALGTVWFLCGVIIPPRLMLWRKEAAPYVVSEMIYCVGWTIGKLLIGHLFAGALAATQYGYIRH